MPVELFNRRHLPQVQDLINTHLSAIVPGWALPSGYILRRLYANPGQYVIDPWVRQRVTLCAIDRDRVVAAAHLLRYGTDAPTGGDYRGAGDIAWLLAWPGHEEAAALLLAAAHDQMRQWQASIVYAWDSHLPVPLCTGIPQQWPHIDQLFRQSGYEPVPERAEAIYGGSLCDIPPAGESPIAQVRLRRWIKSDRGCCFSAMLEDQELGWCEYLCDLTQGGDLFALRGWGELTELFVHEQWRSRGIGAWLVRHAVDWLRLAGCDRVALTVALDDEQNGAGRFYERFGWHPLTRFQQGWRLDSAALHG